jgi:hypothetical protein
MSAIIRLHTLSLTNLAHHTSQKPSKNHGLHRQYHSSSLWLVKLNDMIDSLCCIHLPIREPVEKELTPKGILEMEQQLKRWCEKNTTNTHKHFCLRHLRSNLRQAHWQLTARSFLFFSSSNPLGAHSRTPSLRIMMAAIAPRPYPRLHTVSRARATFCCPSVSVTQFQSLVCAYSPLNS